MTAADVNPSGTTFALLTYGKILLFGIEGGRIDFSRPKECIKIGKLQEEALIFLNDNDLLITNEQGRMYRIRRRLMLSLCYEWLLVDNPSDTSANFGLTYTSQPTPRA